MASNANVKSLVGQLLMVGFDGYSVPAEFKKKIKDYGLGATIYFKRNVQSPAQLAELSNELQFQCRPSSVSGFLIAIDHEGGKVNRLVKPFTKFPGNEFLGEMGSPKVGFQFGVVLAKELKAVGININFAPVVDVYTNSENSVIRNRAFSSDPEVCAKLGSAVCRGIQKMGVVAVAKHFPGHGDTVEDSHFALPKLHKSWEELEKLELVPFRRAVRGRVEGIMTAHILNTALDPERPATLSEGSLGYLRNEMRFNRVIFSDDMEMKAIADHFPDGEAAVLAVKAGCDCLIYRGDTDAFIQGFEAIVHAVENKRIPLPLLEGAVGRMEAMRKVYCATDKPIDVTTVGNSVGIPEHFRLADRITKKEHSPDDAQDFE